MGFHAGGGRKAVQKQTPEDAYERPHYSGLPGRYLQFVQPAVAAVGFFGIGKPRSLQLAAIFSQSARISGIIDAVMIEYVLQLGQNHSQPGSGRIFQVSQEKASAAGKNSTRVYRRPARTLFGHSFPHFLLASRCFRVLLNQDSVASRRR